jgi:hypothetical protein
MMWWHRVVRKVIDRPGKPSRLLSDSFGVRRE